MSSGFDSLLSGVLSSLEKKVSVELEVIFLSEVVPRITDNLMTLYDQVLAAKEPGYDPARPSEAKAAFLSSISKSMKETLSIRGTRVSLSAGNMNDLGYSKHSLAYLETGVGKDPNPLDWLIFYLEGFIGDFYFVTEEDFEQFVKAGLKTKTSLDKFKSWGWYGKGFLIPTNVYRAQQFHTVAGASHKKHPFSGRSKEDIFEKALGDIDMVAIVNKAIGNAVGKM